MAKAIDPVDDEPGISQDKNKTFSVAISDAGITVTDAK
jgi:hypothetical protein